MRRLFFRGPLLLGRLFSGGPRLLGRLFSGGPRLLGRLCPGSHLRFVAFCACVNGAEVAVGAVSVRTPVKGAWVFS